MVQFTTLVGTFALVLATVNAAPNSLQARQNLPDPEGQKNKGNGIKKQFIGGECVGTADCASGCCAKFPNPAGAGFIGVCSGPAVGNANGKLGCGFESGGAGNATGGAGGAGGGAGGANNGGNGGNAGNGIPTKITVIPTQLKPDPINGLQNNGSGNGLQFITGGCTSDRDCASGCCSTINNGVDAPFGICSGPGASRQNGKQCCGFPNGPQRCPATP